MGVTRTPAHKARKRRRRRRRRPNDGELFIPVEPPAAAHTLAYPGATSPTRLFILWRFEAVRGCDGGPITPDRPGCIVHLSNARLNSKAAAQSISEQETLNPNELHPSGRQTQGPAPRRATPALRSAAGRHRDGAAASRTMRLQHTVVSFACLFSSIAQTIILKQKEKNLSKFGPDVP